MQSVKEALCHWISSCIWRWIQYKPMTMANWLCLNQHIFGSKTRMEGVLHWQSSSFFVLLYSLIHINVKWWRTDDCPPGLWSQVWIIPLNSNKQYRAFPFWVSHEFGEGHVDLSLNHSAEDYRIMDYVDCKYILTAIQEWTYFLLADECILLFSDLW